VTPSSHPLRRGFRTLLLLGLALLAARPAQALKSLGAGEASRPFVLVSEAGEERPVAELLGEKGAVLVFWATWNPRSREILAYYEKIESRYEGRGLVILPVNVEHEEPTAAEREAALATYRGWNLPWPTRLDPGYDAFSALGIITLPTSVYIKPTLEVAAVFPGFPAIAVEEIPALLEAGLGPDPRVPVETPKIAYAEPAPQGGAGPVLRMAKLLFERGQTRKALKTVEKARTLDPEWALPEAARVWLLIDAEQDEEAKKATEEAAARAGENPLRAEAAGLMLLSLGKAAEAKALLSPLLDAEEPYPRALLALWAAALASGDDALAKKTADKLSTWPVPNGTAEVELTPWLGDAPLTSLTGEEARQVLLRTLSGL